MTVEDQEQAELTKPKLRSCKYLRPKSAIGLGNQMGQEQNLDVGLALSGGGFRATLFHLGSLCRLNELGWLRKLDIITSVSGGSIIAGVLARNWTELNWQASELGDVATNFRERIEAPIRSFCARTIDVSAGLIGVVNPFSSIPDEVATAYDEHLFQERTLQQLPDPEPQKTPRFVFYATSLQSGVGVRIGKKYLADYKVGRIDSPDLPLSKVVGASSGFPPVLSPVIFEFDDPDVWKPMEGTTLFENTKFRRRLVLTDGGVYDNMGLEAIWQRCKTVLVSDAGAPMGDQEDPAHEPIGQMARVQDILINQTRALRKRKLIEQYKQGERAGTYWGITTTIADYGLADPLVEDNPVTRAQAIVRTRLNKFSPREQGELMNWGYALTDAAMRRWVLRATIVAQGRLPDPSFPL